MKLKNAILSILCLFPFLSFCQVQVDTFFYTGSSQSVTITSTMAIGPISIDIRGGQGGDLSPGVGGNGGQVLADMSFAVGDDLTINVGKKGNDAVNNVTGVFVGSGGTTANSGTIGGTAGSGGGASDIRLNGSSLSDRIIVAGGGGGCGGASGASLNSWPGGPGGGLIGGDGTAASGFPNGGGKGGSQTAGGAVGSSSGGYCSGSATAGALGVGGIGSGDLIGGGGGGGGYYGGGGACFSGGGGGSSYTDLSATNVVHNQGFQSGDGMIIFTYTNCIPSNQTITACDSLVSPSGNYTWTTTGMYADTVNAMVSCGDTAISIDLTVLSSSSSLTAVDACSFYVWPEDNNLYLTSGQYAVVYQSSVGCDSTIMIDLNIITPVVHVVTVSACETYTWPVNGQVYNASANEWLTTGGSAGCDTSYNLKLTIHNPSSQSDTITTCNSYTWPVNGVTYTSGGQYTETYVSSGGCDSTRILDLTINSADASVNNLGNNMLSANANSANYQWLDCENNFSIMLNDTNQIFNATVAGSYAVKVTQNGCVDTSNCFTYYLNKTDFLQDQVAIYPNPFLNKLNVDLGETYQQIEIKILDVTGKLVQSFYFENKQIIDLEINSSKGYYFIEIKTDAGYKASSVIIKE